MTRIYFLKEKGFLDLKKANFFPFVRFLCLFEERFLTFKTYFHFQEVCFCSDCSEATKTWNRNCVFLARTSPSTLKMHPKVIPKIIFHRNVSVTLISTSKFSSNSQTIILFKNFNIAVQKCTSFDLALKNNS